MSFFSVHFSRIRDSKNLYILIPLLSQYFLRTSWTSESILRFFIFLLSLDIGVEKRQKKQSEVSLLHWSSESYSTSKCSIGSWLHPKNLRIEGWDWKHFPLSPAVVLTTEPSGRPIKSSWVIQPLWVCHSFPGVMVKLYSLPFGSVSWIRSPALKYPGLDTCAS